MKLYLNEMLLLVSEKPKMDVTGIRDITIKVGQEFQLRVPFYAVPKPTAVWTRDGNEVEESVRTTQKVAISLTVHNIASSYLKNHSIL